jgi:hypothetical protein
MANTSWLFVIFGEYQVTAQLIAERGLISPLISAERGLISPLISAERGLISPLISKDFPVRHSLIARGNFASVNLNYQK